MPFPIQGTHRRRSALFFLPFSLRGVRYFHPRVFHSSSMAVPLLLILLSSTLSQPFSYCRLQQPATAYCFFFKEKLGFFPSLPPSSPLYASISCPFSACHLGMRPLHISYSHFYSLSLTTSLSVNDFSFPSHISSSLQPLFTIPRYLCSSSSPYVLFLPLSASDLSAI